MKTIKLHGSLGQKYGRKHTLNVRDPAEAIRALVALHDGFKQDLRAGNWKIVKGDLSKNRCVTEETLDVGLGKRKVLHIIPVASGAKSGAGKIIGGIGLIGLAIVTGGVSVAGYGISAMAMGSMGAGMAVAGIAVELAQVPQMTPEDGGSVEQRQSTSFNGPVNVAGEGTSIPVAYGIVKIGSIVVNSSISVERLPIDE